MRTLLAMMFVVVVSAGALLGAQSDTTVYLTLDQATKTMFPGAEIERKDAPSTPEFKAKLKAALGRVTPTVWED